MEKDLILKVLIFILALSGLIIAFVSDRINQKETKPKEITYEIIDENENCSEALEEIARDNELVYYLPCIKSNQIKIKFSDQTEYSLKEVLEKNILTINELKEKGLKIIEYPLEEAVDENYIEEIPENAKKFLTLIEDDSIILTEEEIERYNEEIKKKADMVYDLEKTTSLTKSEILSYINSYQLPTLPKYNGNTTLTKNNTQSILDNRNLEAVKDLETIPKGLIIKRANLRSFPTDVHFYYQKNVADYDSIQETELHVATPVLILHESKDQIWDFIISPFYVGWVKKENIALATQEDWNNFVYHNSFAIITEAQIEVEDTILDMSVKLPYIGVTKEGYQLILPRKKEDGTVGQKQITIPKNQAHIGYLPYTKRNVYIQAFKYEGIPYSWSGMDQGVDCSSYVSNIYRSFGIKFPRNTSSQNKSVGTIIDVGNQTVNQKLSKMQNTNPSLLYQNGHVMLYLGELDGTNYIIHAPGGKQVSVTALTESSSYLQAINKIVKVDKSFLEK